MFVSRSIHISAAEKARIFRFLQRISRITSNYIKAGCSIDEIPVGDFFAPSQLDFTHGSYLCIDGTYYAYLLVPSDGYKSEVPAG